MEVMEFSPFLGFYSPLVQIGRKRAWPGEITASGSIVVNCNSDQTAMWPYNPRCHLCFSFGGHFLLAFKIQTVLTMSA